MGRDPLRIGERKHGILRISLCWKVLMAESLIVSFRGTVDRGFSKYWKTPEGKHIEQRTHSAGLGNGKLPVRPLPNF